MICPKCGENNSDNFRFCGMCGALLAPQSATAAKIANPQESSTLVATNHIGDAASRAGKPVPPISGPSMLGLNLPGANPPSPNRAEPIYPDPIHRDADSLRQTPFSGLDSFLEPEQPKAGGRRVLLLIVLLAALAGAAWWAYGYLDVAKTRRSESATGTGTSAATSTASDNPSGNPIKAPAAAPQDAPPPPDSSSSQVPPPAASVHEGAAQNPDRSDTSQKKDESSKPKPATPPAPATPGAGRSLKSAEKRERAAIAAKTSKLSEPAATDDGAADFHRAEAYLYGRGAAGNCDQAMKYLKTASSKNNAKARSTFGTMYATGHCVPRDLPTSYLWFAMALRVDPNNQILEKDLSAVWNQMTPPERQLATRMKQ